MEQEEITFKIKHKESMEMKELVDAINNSNDAIMTGFNAIIQKNTELILDNLESELQKTNKGLDKLESELQKTNKRLDNLEVLTQKICDKLDIK